MEVSLDLDDFSPLNHRFDLLFELKKRYPNFKISLFTVPWEIRLNPNGKGTPITEQQYCPWVKEVKKAQKEGWMEIYLHGFTHNQSEFHRLTYDEAKKRVIVGMKMFENVGIKLTPLFKAPYWQLSKDAKKAIEDLAVRVVEDGYYNWNIKDQYLSRNKVIAHGHVQDVCGNGLDESFARLLSVPQDANWKFLSELI